MIDLRVAEKGGGPKGGRGWGPPHRSRLSDVDPPRGSARFTCGPIWPQEAIRPFGPAPSTVACVRTSQRSTASGSRASGYGLVVSGLPPGTYDLAVFAREHGVGRFRPCEARARDRYGRPRVPEVRRFGVEGDQLIS